MLTTHGQVERAITATSIRMLCSDIILALLYQDSSSVLSAVDGDHCLFSAYLIIGLWLVGVLLFLTCSHEPDGLALRLSYDEASVTHALAYQQDKS